MKRLLDAIFGARAQVIVGIVTTVVALFVWAYGGYLIHMGRRAELLDLLFHASMFFGVVACYNIVATGLGYRAVERVETAVVEQIDQADEVNVG